jgi:two-component system, sensor histidine kinase LadS
MSFFLRWLVCALFILYSSPCLAQTGVLLNDSLATYRLDQDIEIFIDTTGNTSFDQIIDPIFQKRFFQNKGNLSFGYMKYPIWLKVNAQTSTPSTQWYLELPAPYLEYVDFYQTNKNNKWQTFYSGYYRKQSEKKIPHTGHVFPLRFDDQMKNVAYIKIYGNSPKSFPVIIIEKEKWQEKIRWEDLGYGVFFGILFVMFLYNLFIYFSLRITNYLLYIGTILCTILILSSAAGYSGKFLWPEHPNLNFYAGRLSLPVLTTFLALFSIRFLEVKKYSRIMFYLLVSLIPLSVIAILLVITQSVSSAGNNLISFSVVLFLTTGIVCRAKGNKTANYYIAAWSIYMVGGLLLTLRNSGFFPFNFWTTHFVEFGAAMETFIIALALTDQYRRLKKEKEEAQLVALKIQMEATEKLESKVKARTLELSKAYQELHVTLERNQEQTRIIQDKNSELDSFFYRVSHDLKGPISSLLGLANLARHEVKDEQANFYLEKQQQQILRLNHIITGLIKLTKLHDSGLEKQKIDFNTLIDGCIVSNQELPNFSKVKFFKNLQPDVELFSEWTLLNAIFQNLIENSIKYSHPESPYVNIGVFREDHSVIIQVEDNGMGISKEHQVRIFEMFYRATDASNGSGLGLYILKRSVDRLRGSIQLDSEEGLGSKFTIKLPVES